ncbi:hypothetical protein [Chitinophaga sp. Cy-1792]|uniref:terpene synthase family protein n=1 Tax=Chitinophaga sp. Cy-1792 TaxID=2608339 RepID=UPI0014228C2E|nr:hypothetical protein [Chitinophaga sp. Cy-1792]NIG54418.1 hypothetical protein [Chitinophaga sp. Cy-1792]
MSNRFQGLYCPNTATAYNKNLSCVREKTKIWLYNYGLLTPETEELHMASDFPKMVARMFPNATEELLQVASDFNSLLFVLDDFLDSGEKTALQEQSAYEKFVFGLMQIMEHNRIAVNHPILIAFADVWERMIHHGNQQWRVRFIRSMQIAFDANFWRIQNVHNQVTSIGDYLKHRPAIGGANVFVYLMELMTGYSLTAEQYASKEYNRMSDFCSRSICLANDIFSYQKELLENDEFNIVMLVKKHFSLSIDNAVKYAIQIHNRDAVEFDKVTRMMQRSNFRRYMEALQQMMCGNIEWSRRDTIRYRVRPVHS